MKIDPSLKQTSLRSENRPAAPAAGSQPKASAPETGAAAPSSSSHSSISAHLESQLASIPVVDRARVDRIKEAISSGTYTIDSSKIADGLLGSVQHMLKQAK